MARRNQLEAVKNNTPEEVPAEDKNPLDDPAKQEAILHPDAKEILIGGKAAQLYPLPAEKLRPFRFFARDVMVGAQTPGNMTRLSLRYGEALSERLEQFARYIAASEIQPPAPRDEFSIARRALGIVDVIQDAEVINIFATICELNKSLETPSGPKQ